LKVLILGFDRFDSLEWNLCDTFNRMGIECRIIDPYRNLPFNFRFKLQTLLRFSKKMEDLFWNRFINNLRGLKADLIISTLQNLPPEYIEKIKNSGLSPYNHVCIPQSPEIRLLNSTPDLNSMSKHNVSRAKEFSGNKWRCCHGNVIADNL